MAQKGAPTPIVIAPKTIVNVFLFALLIFLLFTLRNLILVILTSIVIASFVESAVVKLDRYHVHRTMAVILVFILSFLIIFGIFYVFAPVLLAQISGLVYALKDYIPSTSVLNNLAPGGLDSTKQIAQSVANNVSIPDLIQQVQSAVSTVSGGFIKTTSLLFGGIFNVVLITILSFYLSVQEHGVENFLHIITPRKDEPYVIDLWRRTERKIGLWMQGQLLLGVLIGVLVYLGLTILGVQYALVLAVLAAIFELMPLGLVLALIPVLGFAYAGGGLVLAVKALVFFILIQEFEAYLLSPLVMKRVVGIPPIAVILSILVGAELAGFWGIILAIPVVVCLLEFLNDVEKRRAAPAE